MAGECVGSVNRFVLLDNLPLSNGFVTKAKVSSNFLYVALLTQDDVLQVCSMKPGEVNINAVCVSAVIDVQWQQAKEGSCCSLAFLTKEDFLEVMQIDCVGSLKLTSVMSRLNVMALIDGLGNGHDTDKRHKTTLLEFSANIVTVSVCQWHLLSINTLDGSVASHLTVDHIVSGIKDVQLGNRFVFILSEDDLYMVARDTGSILTCWNVNDAENQIESMETFPQSLAVSVEDDVVAVVCADSSVLLYTLHTSEVDEWNSEFSEDMLTRDGSSHHSGSQVADQATLASSIPGAIREWNSRSSLGSVTGLLHASLDEVVWPEIKDHHPAHDLPSFDEDNFVQLLGPSTSTSWWGHNVHRLSALAEVVEPCYSYNMECVAVCQKLCIPPPGSSMTLQDVQVGSGTLSICYKDCIRVETEVMVIDTASGTVLQTASFAEPCAVALGSYIEQTHLVISGTKAFVLICDTSQDKFVNQVMLHHTAGSAEYLSHINGWQQLSLPPALLTLGLNNRQLDMVAFYLKSYCPTLQAYTSEPPPDRGNTITSIISSVILRIETGSTCQIFADQVVKVTLDFLMNHLLAVEAKPSEHCQSVSDVLSNMVKLRGLLKNPTFHRLQSLSAAPVLLPDVKSPCEWERLTTEVLFQNSILQRCIPVAQCVLMEGEKIDNCNCYGLAAVEELGNVLALRALQECDWETATALIENLGQDMQLVLKSFCLNTWNKDLRSVLETVLIQQGLVDDLEQRGLELLHKLERLWSGQSYEAALDQSLWKFPQAQLTAQRKCPCSESFPLPKSLSVKFSGLVNKDASSATAPYALLSYNWLQSLSQTTQQVIMADGLPADDGHLELKSDVLLLPSELWKYWANYNSTAKLCQYICSIFGCAENVVSSVHNSAMEMNKIVTATALPYFRDVILNELARYGIFCSASIQDTVQQLSQNGAVFSCPHPTALPTASLTHLEFQGCFVGFCIQNNLIHVVLELLENIPQEHSVDVGGNHGILLSALTDFAAWEYSPHSVQHVLKACLANVRILQPDVATEPTSLGLLTEPLASVAALLYSSQPLSQVVLNSLMENAIGAGQVDKALLQSCLRPKYPQLELALCQDTSDQMIFDVSVYDLLKINEPFDVGHLFQWRSNLALPFCSQPEMARLHGHQVELDFLYYLSQARPCFATTKFLAQELLLKNVLQNQRVNGAAALAAGFALKNFLMPEISAACVAVVEMLGRDSSWLRVTLEAAQIVVNSLNRESVEDYSREQFSSNLATVLLGITKQQPQSCISFLRLLEDAVESSVYHLGGFCRMAVDSLMLLGLVTEFCRAHCLPPSHTLLQKYAEESNWLMMLLCAQCHTYSKGDVKTLVDHIENGAVREHLQNIMVHLHIKRKAIVARTHAVRPRDTRHTLYQKIGLAREKGRVISGDEQQLSDPDEGMQSSSDETTDSLSGSAEIGDDGTYVHKELLDATLETAHMLDACQPLLIHALETRNSAAVLLADCSLGMFTDSARRLGLLCSWFVASADEAFLSRISAVLTALHSRGWMLEDLSTILVTALEAHRFTLLTQGLSLFMPDSPLVPLIRFLASIVIGEQKQSSLDYLQSFIQTLEITADAAVGLNREQLEQICARLLCHTAGCCPSLRQAYNFLLILQRKGIKHHFCIGVLFPDLGQVLRLLGCISTSGISVNVKALLQGKQDPAFEPECRRALKLLIEGLRFSEAYSFSQAADLGLETVLVAQLQEELCRRKSVAQWQDPMVRHAFWTQCLSSLSADSKPDTVASFLKNNASSVTSHSERFFLLHLTLKAQGTFQEEKVASTFSSLEADMWNSRFEAELDIEFAGAEGKTFLDARIQDGMSPHDLLRQGQCLVVLKEFIGGRYIDTEKERQAVSRVIGQQLDHGCLGSARQLAAYFDHTPHDMVLVQACLNLAESRISNAQADATLRSVCDQEKGYYQRRRLSHVFVRRSSFAGSEYEDLEEQLVSKETLETLERLRDACSHGNVVCNLIVTYFRIACVLDLNFTYIIEHPSVFVVLKMLLKSSASDKFVLARELTTAHAMPDAQVAEFVAEETLSALYALAGSSEYNRQELMSNPCSEPAIYFSSLVSLCQEPLLVGNHLLDIARNTDADAFYVQVELCVLAHHCFSLACSTEGITRVLGRVKLLATTLAEVEEYGLMVRLLTGVGRYSELACILDLLLDNHQFELLLKKGMEKISDLKMALLDYLRRCHPSDRDMFTMVALHFLLYREIAEMHEHEAQMKLQSLSIKPLDNCRATVEQLEHIMQFWADAAESYSKADCPRLSQRCCRQASLVALQLHLLPSGRRLLNLQPAEVNEFIIGHSNFLEAQLVAEVYSEHRVWPQAFYQQVVVRGNGGYLHDFHVHLGVSPSLIQEIMCRFKKEENASEKISDHIKRVIRLTKNVSDLHQLALDLNYQEIASQVLEGDGGAFVCDTFRT